MSALEINASQKRAVNFSFSDNFLTTTVAQIIAVIATIWILGSLFILIALWWYVYVSGS